jgi:hypothetical protein
VCSSLPISSLKLVPLIAFLLPMVFIFGNSARIAWESFLVVFMIQPFVPGTGNTRTHHITLL